MGYYNGIANGKDDPMKHTSTLLCLAMAMLMFLPLSAGGDGGGMRIENGMAQPFLKVTDAQREDYTNEGSDILRFVVYVETDLDTDLDGKRDLVKTMVQLPRPAAEGVYRAPAIYEARPYIAGMYGYRGTLPKAGTPTFDFSVLYKSPPARVPRGERTALEAAEAARVSDWFYHLEGDPFDQTYLGNLTAYDEFLARGFAVVQTAGLGTWGSEGILCCSGPQETQAFRCVVEWLTGKRNAFTDRTGEIGITASWCSGRIGMTGRSYAGAMAFQVASTGVEGLETVVPVAGIARWYDYANAQGLPSGLGKSWDSITDLAMMCASRFFQEGEEKPKGLFERYLAGIRDEQIALRGNLGPFWQERDYTGKTGFRASALIVQGLRDEVVRPRHFALMLDTFRREGCFVRCILHQNGHVTPANEQTRTDVMIGGHTYTKWLNLWFTHFLLGVENEVSAMPAFTVQSNVDGRFYGTDRWMEESLRMPSGTEGEALVRAEGAYLSNTALLNETFDGASGADHLLWRMDVPEEIPLGGTVQVHLRVKTSDTDRPVLMVGAVLVDHAETPFPCFDPGAIGVLGQTVLKEGGVDRGEGAAKYDLVAWQQTPRQRALVTYGTLDLRNPEGEKVETEIAADTYYEYTLDLQPTFYTVPAGHQLELYIVPFCGFSDDTVLFETFSREELEAMGLDPEALVPLTRDYGFTVDCGAGYALLPRAKP